MTTATGSPAPEAAASPSSDDVPSFEEVIDENAPYIAALYVLVLVSLGAFIDHEALLEGRLTYNALIGSDLAGSGFAELIAAGFAAAFVLVTVVGVFYAASVVSLQRRRDMDPYDLEERISTLTVVPALQLFTVILCPVVTRQSLVAGMEHLVALVL